MTEYLRHLDWKVLAFALLGCYFVPWLVLGTLASAAWTSDLTWRAQLMTVLMLAYVLAPPFAGGYFAARYARSLPQLHVLLVSVLGFLVVAISSKTSSPAMFLGYSVAFFALAALGAFIRLRGTRGMNRDSQ